MMADYEWDDNKAHSNKARHGVEFADAVEVFADPAALTTEDAEAGEQRFATTGTDGFGRLLVVYA